MRSLQKKVLLPCHVCCVLCCAHCSIHCCRTWLSEFSLMNYRICKILCSMVWLEAVKIFSSKTIPLYTDILLQFTWTYVPLLHLPVCKWLQHSYKWSLRFTCSLLLSVVVQGKSKVTHTYSSNKVKKLFTNAVYFLHKQHFWCSVVTYL